MHGGKAGSWSAREVMSQELIYEVLYDSLALADSILQIWMTVTFAVIVATYIAGVRVGHVMYRLVSCLYGLYAAVLITRFGSSAFQIFHYRSTLIERGFEPWPVPYWVAITIGSGTFVLMLAGTAATLWFMRWTRSGGSDGA
jgi:hypothetical protein